jgi:cytochrome c-type biogenesis protein CcmH
MKRQVKAMLAAGYSQEQVEDYFVGSYGESVLMAPRARGFSLVVWLTPLALVLIVLVAGTQIVRRRTAMASSSNHPIEGRGATGQPQDKETSLDPWIERIRAEANKD